MSPVYVAMVEVAPLPGCVVVAAPAVGGFARCYLGAASEERAMADIVQALEEERLRVVAVEWCVREDEVEWENPGDEEGERLIQEARGSGEVIIGRIDTWATDE